MFSNGLRWTQLCEPPCVIASTSLCSDKLREAISPLVTEAIFNLRFSISNCNLKFGSRQLFGCHPRLKTDTPIGVKNHARFCLPLCYPRESGDPVDCILTHAVEWAHTGGLCIVIARSIATWQSRIRESRLLRFARNDTRRSPPAKSVAFHTSWIYPMTALMGGVVTLRFAE